MAAVGWAGGRGRLRQQEEEEDEEEEHSAWSADGTTDRSIPAPPKH